MTRKLGILVSGLALLGLALLALAEPGLAQSGPNGGMVAGAGHHKTELVVGQTELTVYLTENGKPHESTGTTMRAVIQQAGKTSTVDFADQDGKRLVAKLPAPLDKGAIVVISGKDHHGDRFNARYVIK